MRIGVFGGTFDPPHVGHLILAAECSYQLDLARMLWVLTPDPPHKKDQSITSFTHRIAMIQAAIEDNPLFELSRVDVDRPGPHYAVDTLRVLAKMYPEADLVYLVGGDSLHDLPTWYQPAELVAQVSALGVMRRPGDQVDLGALDARLPGLAAKVRVVSAPLLDISSHQIRARIASGQPYRYYLPPAVYALIQATGLYR